MQIFRHELRRNRLSLMIWTAVIAYMLGICIVIYPEMAPQMNQMTDMFADMGSFTAAFGMDQLNFGEFLGYFAVECGNALGLGGALFASVAGISALAKEEKDGTAEFFLTHPVSRENVFFGKLISVIAQILILNVVVFAVCLGLTASIGEQAQIGKTVLLFVAYTLLQLQIGLMTFGISAFLKNGSLAVGLGISFGTYFLNIVANLTQDAKVLKYITPFGYTDGGYIVKEQTLEFKYLLAGMALAIVFGAVGFLKYRKKDIC